jgi:hypothetical protein
MVTSGRPTGAEMAARLRKIPPEELPEAVAVLEAGAAVLRNPLVAKLAMTIVAMAEAIAGGAELTGIVATYDEMIASLTGDAVDVAAGGVVAGAEWFLGQHDRHDDGDV